MVFNRKHFGTIHSSSRLTNECVSSAGSAAFRGPRRGPMAALPSPPPAPSCRSEHLRTRVLSLSSCALVPWVAPRGRAVSPPPAAGVGLPRGAAGPRGPGTSWARSHCPLITEVAGRRAQPACAWGPPARRHSLASPARALGAGVLHRCSHAAGRMARASWSQPHE